MGIGAVENSNLMMVSKATEDYLIQQQRSQLEDLQTGGSVPSARLARLLALINYIEMSSPTSPIFPAISLEETTKRIIVPPEVGIGEQSLLPFLPPTLLQAMRQTLDQQIEMLRHALEDEINLKAQGGVIPPEEIERMREQLATLDDSSPASESSDQS